MLSSEIQDYLTQKETLEEWANLTLEERTVKLQERCGIKIHEKTLMGYYKRLNVRWLAPQYRFYRATTQQEQLE